MNNPLAACRAAQLSLSLQASHSHPRTAAHCHPHQPFQLWQPLWCVLAIPEEGRWVDCYQSSGKPSVGWAARLLLLDTEVLISRLQRPAYMIYLEVAFLSADVVLVQPDCLVKQPQEWILLASVQREEWRYSHHRNPRPQALLQA